MKHLCFFAMCMMDLHVHMLIFSNLNVIKKN